MPSNAHRLGSLQCYTKICMLLFCTVVFFFHRGIIYQCSRSGKPRPRNIFTWWAYCHLIQSQELTSGKLFSILNKGHREKWIHPNSILSKPSSTYRTKNCGKFLIELDTSILRARTFHKSLLRATNCDSLCIRTTATAPKIDFWHHIMSN